MTEMMDREAAQHMRHAEAAGRCTAVKKYTSEVPEGTCPDIADTI